MKRSIFCLLMLVLFCACKKNNNGPSTASANLVNKWYAISSAYVQYSNGTPGNTSNTSYNHTDYIQFNLDGTGTQVKNGTTSSFTYTSDNNIITFKYTASQQTDMATIKSLTANKLELYFDHKTDQQYTYDLLMSL